MIELTVTEDAIATWIHVKGRVDSMTAPEIQQKIDALILGGKRILVADLSGVSYISSAGLRIFVMSQKQLKKTLVLLIWEHRDCVVIPVIINLFSKGLSYATIHMSIHIL